MSDKYSALAQKSDGQAVAVNLDIEPVQRPEQVFWVDPTHPAPPQVHTRHEA